MILLPAAILLFVAFALGLEPDRRHREHVLSRLRAPGRRCSSRPGISPRRSSIERRTFLRRRSGDFDSIRLIYFIELFHDLIYFGRWPQLGSWLLAAVIAAGEPGDRICHIQVARRQDGIPTLSRTAQGCGMTVSSSVPLIELCDVSLRFINYSDKGHSLKRAVLDLLLRRESPVPVSEFWALRDINLRINHGERVGIVGGNGAGKSTLLRLLARIYPPSSGTVEVRGNVGAAHRDGRRLQHRAVRL